MTPKIRKSSHAGEDLIEIWLYVAANNAAAADRLLDRFEARFELLATQPRSGMPRDDLGRGVRQVTIGEYLVFYATQCNPIEALRVLHGRRRITPDEIDGSQ